VPPAKWNWNRLAELVLARRRELGLSQMALADKAGVHVTTIRHLEAGRVANELPRSRNQIEPELGWAGGSFEAVLNGGEPTLVDERAAAAGPAIDPAKVAGALELLRSRSDDDDEVAQILESDLPPDTKFALLELHRERLARAERQTREDRERAERAMREKGA